MVKAPSFEIKMVSYLKDKPLSAMTQLELALPPDVGHKDMSFMSDTRTIYLNTNVDEDAPAISLVPVSAMIAVMVVLVVMTLPVIKAIPVVIPLMSPPIVRP